MRGEIKRMIIDSRRDIIVIKEDIRKIKIGIRHKSCQEGNLICRLIKEGVPFKIEYDGNKLKVEVDNK